MAPLYRRHVPGQQTGILSWHRHYFAHSHTASCHPAQEISPAIHRASALPNRHDGGTPTAVAAKNVASSQPFRGRVHPLELRRVLERKSASTASVYGQCCKLRMLGPFSSWESQTSRRAVVWDQKAMARNRLDCDQAVRERS